MFRFDIYDEDGYYTTITGDDIEDVMDAMKHDLAFHMELYSGEVTIKGCKSRKELKNEYHARNDVLDNAT